MAESKVNIEAEWVAMTALSPAAGSLVPNEAIFNQEKIGHLTDILRKSKMSQAQVDELIRRTQLARVEFCTDTTPHPKEAIKKLIALEKAAKRLIAAWSDLGIDIQESLTNHIEGHWPTSASHCSSERIQERIELMETAKRLLSRDLNYIAGGANELASVLDKSSASARREYKCVISIADAWLSVSGRAPTRTGNNEPKRGVFGSQFQRFVAEAMAPHPFREGVVNEVIQQFRNREKIR